MAGGGVAWDCFRLGRLIGAGRSANHFRRRHPDRTLRLRHSLFGKLKGGVRDCSCIIPARNTIPFASAANAGVSFCDPDTHCARAFPPEEAASIMVSSATFLDLGQYTWFVHRRIRSNFRLLGSWSESIPARRI